MRRLMAAYTNASPLAQSRSHNSHRAAHIVLAHPPVVAYPGEGAFHHPARGNTTKPFGGISRSQWTTVPSFSHCSAHAVRTSLGAGFFGRSRRSTLHPNTLSTHSLPLSSPR